MSELSLRQKTHHQTHAGVSLHIPINEYRKMAGILREFSEIVDNKPFDVDFIVSVKDINPNSRSVYYEIKGLVRT